tara:strand:- start:240 stop:389 length:150 start_codon:yes stop_codon:yes gene_type:complete
MEKKIKHEGWWSRVSTVEKVGWIVLLFVFLLFFAFVAITNMYTTQLTRL